jgi:predicted nucleotidyltransferase
MSPPIALSAVRNEIVRCLRQRGDIAAAYLLGSAAHGRLRPDSDIDIALLPTNGRRISLQDRLAVAAELEIRMGRPFDIGVVTSGNLVYASEAILNGRRLVTFDADHAAAMETRLLGCYVQFRQDRRDVEAAYRAA